jgi:hypothetical protein
VPSLSEVFAATERSNLWVADMEVLRLHYHYTLQHWRRRFATNRARAAELYDERFCRMWEYYLAAVDVGFSNGSNMVFQLLIWRRSMRCRSFATRALMICDRRPGRVNSAPTDHRPFRTWAG